MDKERNRMGEWKEIEIKFLKKAAWNYKTENEELSQKLLNQIKKNGQVENILIRRIKGKYEWEVLNGNHRLDVFNKLNMAKVMAYDFGEISELQAKRIAIETNETKFETDNIKLAEIISDLQKEIDIKDLEVTMPYSQEELDRQIALMNFDWKQFKDTGAGSDKDDNIIKIAITVDKKDWKMVPKIKEICEQYKSCKFTQI